MWKIKKGRKIWRTLQPIKVPCDINKKGRSKVTLRLVVNRPWSQLKANATKAALLLQVLAQESACHWELCLLTSLSDLLSCHLSLPLQLSRLYSINIDVSCSSSPNLPCGSPLTHILPSPCLLFYRDKEGTWEKEGKGWEPHSEGNKI